MYFLTGKVSIKKDDISWNIGGSIWTPDKYYSDCIVKISIDMEGFSKQSRVAAIKSFEQIVAKLNINWIETQAGEWIIDLELLRDFIAKLPNNDVAISSLDKFKGFISIEPEIEWEKSDLFLDEDKAVAAIHIFKEYLTIATHTTSKIWDIIHPQIVSVAKSRFVTKHYADSVEAAMKEINLVVKKLYETKTGKELDGYSLMNTAFSVKNPEIKLSDLITQSDKDIQQGYMNIFAGAMMGIRNPKAHNNLIIDEKTAIHLIMLASLLMYKLDESK